MVDEVARAWAATEIEQLKADVARLEVDRDGLRVCLANVLMQYDEMRDQRDDALALIEIAEGRPVAR